jgi:hypothetical protein
MFNTPVIHTVGDSILYGVGSPISNVPQTLLMGFLGNKWQIINNNIPGGTTEQIMPLMSAITLDTNCQYAIVLMGINDIASGQIDTFVEGNLQSTYQFLHAAGIKVIACTMTPWKGHPAWNAQRETYTENINSWIMSNASAADYRVDVYSALVDPNNAQTLLPAYVGTIGDWLHLSTLGQETIATAIFNGVTWSLSPMSTSMGTRSVSSPDFTQNTLITDGNWHTLDLSGIVPFGAKAVLIRAMVQQPLAGYVLYLNPNGDTNVNTASAITSLAPNIQSYNDLAVILDDNRKIYFKSLQNSNYTGIGLTISGWWF